MDTLLKRTILLPDKTFGELYINNKYFCDTLEPVDRGLTKEMPINQIKAIKVPNRTAIPTGKYNISYAIISPKYSQIKWYYDYCQGKMPRLLDVPAFDGVLVHPGNFVGDTQGCLLLGKRNKDQLVDSKKTWLDFMQIKPDTILITR